MMRAVDHVGPITGSNVSFPKVIGISRSVLKERRNDIVAAVIDVINIEIIANDISSTRPGKARVTIGDLLKYVIFNHVVPTTAYLDPVAYRSASLIGIEVIVPNDRVNRGVETYMTPCSLYATDSFHPTSIAYPNRKGRTPTTARSINGQVLDAGVHDDTARVPYLRQSAASPVGHVKTGGAPYCVITSARTGNAGHNLTLLLRAGTHAAIARPIRA